MSAAASSLPSISLVGLPGSGKSSVGRQLASRLGLPFTDSDAVIEQRLGCSIREFFERPPEAGGGELRFREIEAEVIAGMKSQAGVLATGGGAVLRSENRQALRERGTVIYLQSSPEELMRRLRRDTKRPLLQTSDPMQRLRELHAQRDPLYRETAHFVIETGRPTASTIVNMIVMQLELSGRIAQSQSLR